MFLRTIRLLAVPLLTNLYLQHYCVILLIFITDVRRKTDRQTKKPERKQKKKEKMLPKKPLNSVEVTVE